MGSSLESQIKYAENTIRTIENTGGDASYEKSLVKSWKEYLPGGPKHQLWLQHCGFKAPVKATTDTHSRLTTTANGSIP